MLSDLRFALRQLAKAPGFTAVAILTLALGIGALSQGGKFVGLGLLIGLIAALAGGRLLESLLFKTSTHDPLTLAAITVLLAAVATLACLLPARRATKVDPMIALRSE